MKRMKVVFLTLLSIALILLPFALPCVIALAAPPQYENTFVGVLDEKFERLNSIEEDKIVIIGGSSVAFGVDSALIEEYVGMPTVNFGLYATLGTKLMLDLSKSAVKSGDVIIVAPELDAQTLSLYFNTESTLQAMDGNFEMLFHVGEENFFPLLSGMWKFAKEKLSIMKSGDAPNPDGVYNSKNFNEYGDLVYPRKNNVMSLYYDENVMINPDVSIISEDFIDYINDYVSYAKLRGASVYFGFAPMNEQGIIQKDCLDELAEFEKTLKGMLDCPVISNIKDYVYEAGYFYDTNFHLNDAGKIVNTVNLTKDLLLEMGKATLVKEEIPAAPKLPGIEMKFEGEDENAKYFTYEKAENGAYKITGLSELGKSEKVLTLPLGYNGVKVLYVGDEAFVGGVAEKIILPENSNIRAFTSYAFNEASALRDLWIYYPIAEDIMPADFSDMPSGFKIHIPPKSNYDFDYNWGPLSVTYVKDAVK
jgi:hypothetical protein